MGYSSLLPSSGRTHTESGWPAACWQRATSHWLALDELSRLGATPVGERVVFDGKYVTAAGVSAGIDMGLALAGRIAGDEVA